MDVHGAYCRHVSKGSLLVLCQSIGQQHEGRQRATLGFWHADP